MVINHNIASLNANRMMGVNQSNSSKSMEKLSSGLRINRAGDDAAGLAISEKMRAQVRGLDQASANGQDGISMIQTAEGALSETHSILQRMRELAVQSSNDTNVTVDRSEIQKEMDELAKEVTRISNNTEFNTQKLINGGITDAGIKSAKFHIGANANQDITLSINAMDAKSLGITRDVNTATLDNTNATKINTAKVDSVDVSKTLAAGDYQIKVADTAAGAVAASSTGTVTVAAGAATGVATADTNVVLTRTAGAAATAAKVTGTATAATTDLTGISADAKLTVTIGGTAYDLDDAALKGATGAGKTITDLIGALNTAISAKGTAAEGTGADAGKIVITSKTPGATSVGVTITGSTVTGISTAFGFTGAETNTGSAAGADTWQATGDYTGTVGDAETKLLANGVSVDTTKLSAYTVGATVTISGTKDAGTSVQLFNSTGTTAIGNEVNISKTTGGNYTIGDTTTGQAKVNFKAGEAVNGTSTITVATSAATASVKQTDGTMSDAKAEGGLNVSTQPAASSAITTIQNAIETVSAERSKLGAYQNRLEHTIANLGTSSENLTAAESRIRDVDMAKEMSTFSKNNILAQAAQSMLAQANQQPQQVLQLLQ